MQEEAAEDLSDNDFRRVEATAHELLKTMGVTLDPDTADSGRLCRKLLEAKDTYTRIEARRWQGEPYEPLIRQSTVNGHSLHAAPLPQRRTSVIKLLLELGHCSWKPLMDTSGKIANRPLHASTKGGVTKVRKCARWRSARIHHHQAGLFEV